MDPSTAIRTFPSLQYSSNVLPRLADLTAQGEEESQRAPVNLHKGVSTMESAKCCLNAGCCVAPVICK